MITAAYCFPHWIGLETLVDDDCLETNVCMCCELDDEWLLKHGCVCYVACVLDVPSCSAAMYRNSETSSSCLLSFMCVSLL